MFSCGYLFPQAYAEIVLMKFQSSLTPYKTTTAPQIRLNQVIRFCVNLCLKRLNAPVKPRYQTKAAVTMPVMNSSAASGDNDTRKAGAIDQCLRI